MSSLSKNARNWPLALRMASLRAPLEPLFTVAAINLIRLSLSA